MNRKKFYLAHARDEREKIRKWELDFENRTGIDLVNPFFDHEAPEKEFNNLGKEKYFFISEEEKRLIVLKDKELIASKEVDGVVAFISCKSWGTAMEIFFANQLSKPVFLIVTNGDQHHPWLISHSTKIFTSEKDFEEFLLTWSN